MRVLVVIVVIAACAKTPMLPLRLDTEPPAGSIATTITARDGTELHSRYWAPNGGNPRALVVIVHGLKDHSARYHQVASLLAAGGYGVYAFDLRGHGRSAGPRVAPRAWLDYVDDVDQVLGSIEVREQGQKIFLFGHSMGGAIAALAAIRHRPQVAGLILSAPALVVDEPPLALAATRVLATLAPRAPALELDNRDFSSDPTNAKLMAADPLISQPAAPARTAAGLLGGIRAIWAEASALTMPILALHGTRDKLTASAGSRALLRVAPSRDKTLRIYEAFAHDLLHEREATRVENDILMWLDAHTGGAPVEAPPEYTKPLRGDSRGWTQALELGAGLSAGSRDTDFAGGLSVQAARGAPLGWHGGLTARLAGRYKAAAVRPLGLALRAGSTTFGISGGGALVTGTELAVSAGAWIEQPLGPLHVGAIAELARTFDDVPMRGPLGSDLVWTTVTLRLGRDHAYWPGARAGVGPTLTSGAAWVGDSTFWIVTVGLQLYGID